MKKRSLQNFTRFLEKAKGRFVGEFGNNNITFNDLYNNSELVYKLLVNNSFKSLEQLGEKFNLIVDTYHLYLDEISDNISFDDYINTKYFIQSLNALGINLE